MTTRELTGGALFAVVFVGSGIAVLVAGEDLAFGLMLTLTGSSVALFTALPLVRSRVAPVRIGTLDGEPSFVFATSQGREIVIQVALFAITAGAAAMAATGSVRAWLALGVLAPVTLWWSWLVIRGGRAITLTPTRVVVTTDGREELTWDEVELDLGGLEDLVASAEQLTRALTLYAQHPERRAAIGTEAELARVI